MEKLVGRRSFLSAASAGLVATAVGCKGGPATPSLPPENPDPSKEAASAEAGEVPSGLTVEVIAAAEILARVKYTDSERAQILRSLSGLFGQIEARRQTAIARSDAPALVFDPLLPGRSIAAQPTRVRLAALAKKPLPAADADIAYAPLPQLADWIRRKQLSSARLTAIYQRRLRELGPSLQCVITETAEIASRQAARADAEIAAGRYRGPLHGIPYGAKDLFDTAAVATTYGAEPFKTRVATDDATVIKRLEEAGAVLIAKTSLGALAYGDQWYGGTTRNPWNLAEGSSGSSAGSAAGVAAGLFGFALGTETLGSIISPCTRCGTTGLRPTFGRVPRGGAMPLCWSMDKIGPICRTVGGTALVLAALSGADPTDVASRTAALDIDLRRPILAGLRVGYDAATLEASSPILETIKAAGAILSPLDLSDVASDVLLPILLAEASAAFEDLTLSNRDDELAWQDDDAWPNSMRAARFITAIDLVQADRVRRQAMIALDARFADLDLICAPASSSLLVSTNFTGHPALVLRSGFSRRRPLSSADKPDESAPVFEAPESIVLYGKLFDEATLCRAGSALEERLGVADRRPPIG